MNTYHADALAELKHLRFRTQQQRSRARIKLIDNRSTTPAINMDIGDWYIDELGIWTREIKAAV
jgi:hypothetical protein